MSLLRWWMQAILVIWMVLVGLAYITGTSPVLGLIGIICVTASILLHGVVKKLS